jgi:hypothetical protein
VPGAIPIPESAIPGTIVPLVTYVTYITLAPDTNEALKLALTVDETFPPTGYPTVLYISLDRLIVTRGLRVP